MSMWLADELAYNDKSLLGYWPTSRDPNDYSGNGSHVITQYVGIADSNSKLRRISGRVGLALDNGYHFWPYDEDTDVLYNSLKSIPDATLSAWFLPDPNDVNNDTTIISYGSAGLGSSLDGWRWYYKRSNRTINYVYGNGVTETVDSVPLSGSTNNDKWINISLVGTNRAGSTYSLQHYYNGVPIKNTSGVTFGTNTFNRVRFGTYSSGLVYPQGYGTIGSVRIYKRCLYASEIRNLYNRELYQFNEEYDPRFSFSRSSGVSLYTFGSADGSTASSGNIPLFITNQTASGVIPLYTYGIPGSGNSNITLYTKGSTYPEAEKYTTLYEYGYSPSSGAIPLYVGGLDSSSGNIPLFIKYFPEGRMNLFIQAEEASVDSGNMPLTVYGATVGTSGIFGGVPLYLESENFPSKLNLVIKGPDSITTVRNMNLYIKGEPYYGYGSTSLFLQNNQSGVTNNVPLFINAPGGLSGGLAYSSNMNLTLLRDPANSISLFMNAPGTPSSGNLTFIVTGNSGASSGVNFAIPATYASLSGSSNLYVHGF